ncbi:MAG: hypothetical protein J2P38_04295 [Candidatus Dormibacteraeota bacterium]|nr:hypothetical protein [Candidatus Dormibacteraeota bacterium]
MGRPTGERQPLLPEAQRLAVLWAEHRGSPFPAAEADSPARQEIAFFDSWLGTIVESALAHGGRLVPAHRHLLDARRQESDPAVWRAAAELGGPFRPYVARLLAMQEELVSLPDLR